jgi:hypothetical protein
MNLITVILVVGVVSALNIPGSSNLDLNRSIKGENIIHKVVVITNSCNPTNYELGIPGHTHIFDASMTSEWKPSILLEYANTTFMSGGGPEIVYDGIEERCGSGTVPSRD